MFIDIHKEIYEGFLKAYTEKIAEAIPKTIAW